MFIFVYFSLANAYYLSNKKPVPCKKAPFLLGEKEQVSGMLWG